MEGTRTSLLTKENVNNFVDSIDAFVFDCDGVLWRAQPSVTPELLPGVSETLKLLKKLVFTILKIEILFDRENNFFL
jgi:hypothetical protein